MSHTDFAAGVIVFHQPAEGPREYLLIKNAAGHWEFPKGHPKPGEGWQQAALRELFEETGLGNVRLIRGFARKIGYVFRDKRNRVVHKTVRFVLGQAGSSSVRLSDEHTEFVYLDFQSGLSRLTHVSTRQLLRDADAFMQNHMIGLQPES